MSVLPISWFLLAPLVLLGFFNWDLTMLSSALLIGVGVSITLVVDLPKVSYYQAFLLFIITELCLFLAFLHSSSWFFSGDWQSISDSLEIPFVGCFLLLGSSIPITGFHHILCWSYSYLFLVHTALLGTGSVFLQVLEFSEASANFNWNWFYGACLSTVGLHFTHVFIGVSLMLGLLVITPPRGGFYYCTLLTWYWHFVDYIWLLVYALVYIC
uniref:Cytochrome c oxidase subunit 3 n=1 Tax=Khawia sinensis TaxID=125900 RepID=A0A1W5J2M9_9CEST|nr:cytochrome c oxidase subunit III [Khawia sinensis]ALK26528.1 cytochrome c oxidase subunit III [Khawia sinensis]